MVKKNKGSILAAVTVFIFIFTLLGLFSMRLIVLQQSSTDSEIYFTRAHFAALYASELALYKIMQYENLANEITAPGAERKFLKGEASCFNYSGDRWYPLKDHDFRPVFADDTYGQDGGIHIAQHVEETTDPSLVDGFIPGRSEVSSYPSWITTQDLRNLARDYGTYKYYTIVTTATMYENLKDKTGSRAAAEDIMFIVIAYSAGTSGTKRYNSTIYHQNNPDYHGRGTPEYIHSAPRLSMITGEVLPIYRYYVRGRR